MRGLFWRAPVMRIDPADEAEPSTRWPPGVMLLFAFCLSFILWAGIIAAFMWAHRALGWF